MAGAVTVYPLSDDKKAHGSPQFQMHFYTSPPTMPFPSFQYINSGTKGEASKNGYVSLGWIRGYTQLAGEIHAEWWPQTPFPPVKSHVKVHGTELLGHRQCPSATGIYMIGTLDYIDSIQIKKGHRWRVWRKRTVQPQWDNGLSHKGDWLPTGGTWRQLIGWWQKVTPVSSMPALRSSSILQFLNVPIVLEKSKSVTIGSSPGTHPPDSVSFFALHLFISLGVHHTTAWLHLLSSTHVRSSTYADNGMRWSSDYRKKTC